uniref:Uncharacterized protein n=1 Tax=mine drainage metagenome TaxID=410659 RepID=E6Q2E2_9ZZZZ
MLQATCGSDEAVEIRLPQVGPGGYILSSSRVLRSSRHNPTMLREAMQSYVSERAQIVLEFAKHTTHC